MKLTKFILLTGIIAFIWSCSSVRVVADYDRQANFKQYTSFAFYKPGIDKAEVSDLDKKRILRAIETEMVAKGFTKSEDPDILISILTKEKERVNMNNAGWNPYWGPGFNNNVSTRTEGILYIDFIDAERKDLVWQGKGSGTVTENMDRKEERINKFVREILAIYPPGSKQKRMREEESYPPYN